VWHPVSRKITNDYANYKKDIEIVLENTEKDQFVKIEIRFTRLFKNMTPFKTEDEKLYSEFP
jgi:predicted phage-related endonuclease